MLKSGFQELLSLSGSRTQILMTEMSVFSLKDQELRVTFLSTIHTQI